MAHCVERTMFIVLVFLLSTSIILLLLRGAFPSHVDLVIFAAAFVRADWGNSGHFPLAAGCAAATVLIDLVPLYGVCWAVLTALNILIFAGSLREVISTASKLDSATIFRAKIGRGKT